MKRKLLLRTAALGVVSAAMLAAASVASATTVTEYLVSPGTAGVTQFPQNKQNESPMAVNPTDALNAISGANDEIQEPDCTPATGGSSSCPFDPTVDITGVYTTTNGGTTWSQQILNWFPSSGITSDGDPGVAFGPKRSGGVFSFGSGARAYFASLAGSPTFGPMQELIAVARSDDKGDTWSAPVVATTRDNPVNFNDKVAIWADKNPSSSFFGNVYVSWTLFTGNPTGNFGEANVFSPEPIMVARSTDGGLTFGKPVKITASFNNGAVGGRQGSTVRSAPNGDVYVFWDGSLFHQSAVLGARSTDGGKSFSKPFLVSFKNDNPSPLPGASFRDNSFPNADIDANGKLYVVWSNYTSGHGVVKLATSTNNGASWTASAAADVTSPDRSAFYPAVATSGSGPVNVFIGFNAIDDVAAGTAPGAAVVSYDSYFVLDTGSGFGSPPVKISGTSSDPDAASTNSLGSQFLGDYNGAAAGPDGKFWFSWTDTRDGDTCSAVDTFRAGGAKPNIYDSCTPDFGNSDIYVAKVTP